MSRVSRPTFSFYFHKSQDMTVLSLYLLLYVTVLGHVWSLITNRSLDLTLLKSIITKCNITCYIFYLQSQQCIWLKITLLVVLALKSLHTLLHWLFTVNIVFLKLSMHLLPQGNENSFETRLIYIFLNMQANISFDI